MDRLSAVGVVTWPLARSGAVPLGNLIHIITSIADDTYLISGGEGAMGFLKEPGVEVILVERRTSRRVAGRIMGYLATQIEIALKMLQVGKKVDLWIFFIGGPDQVIPVIMAKLLGRRVCISFAESSAHGSASQGGLLGAVEGPVLQGAHAITCSLSDIIILYSPALVDSWHLEMWRDRISFAHEHRIDFGSFRVGKEMMERKKIVGFIGRLSKEKGIVNFLIAAKNILDAGADVEFLIVGDGDERDLVEGFVEESHGRARFISEVSHEEIPACLNELSLLVLPSLTEGLPNILLEAMACGTPVLATPVGSIPDIIEPGRTGFLLEGGSHEQIAHGIMAALSDQDLPWIANNAREKVLRDFAPEVSISNYQRAIARVLKVPQRVAKETAL